MYPTSYFDLRVLPAAGSSRASAMAHDIAALLVKFTHAIAARQGLRHALALPLAKTGSRPSPGNVIRVFADQPSQLDALADELERQHFVRDYVSVGRIKTLAPDYLPPGFVEYQRFRIPNRRSRLHESRAKRIAEADQLPHLRLNSSSGHRFSLFVKPVRHASADCGAESATPSPVRPDVYGLSVSARRFALPLTPEDVPRGAQIERGPYAAAEA